MYAAWATCTRCRPWARTHLQCGHRWQRGCSTHLAPAVVALYRSRYRPQPTSERELLHGVAQVLVPCGSDESAWRARILQSDTGTCHGCRGEVRGKKDTQGSSMVVIGVIAPTWCQCIALYRVPLPAQSTVCRSSTLLTLLTHTVAGTRSRRTTSWSMPGHRALTASVHCADVCCIPAELTTVCNRVPVYAKRPRHSALVRHRMVMEVGDADSRYGPRTTCVTWSSGTLQVAVRKNTDAHRHQQTRVRKGCTPTLTALSFRVRGRVWATGWQRRLWIRQATRKSPHPAANQP